MPAAAARPQGQGKQKQLPRIEPIRLIRRPDAFDGPDWIFQLKYDGFRGLLYIEPDNPRFISRNGNRMKRFDDLASAIARQLNAGYAILDGEIVTVDKTGRPIFNDLFMRRGELIYMAFDLLWLDGQDLRSRTLAERKARLKKLLSRKSGRIGYVQHFQKEGKALFEEVKKNDLEGIVAKRQASPYTSETTWYKIKNPGYSQSAGRHDLFAKHYSH